MSNPLPLSLVRDQKQEICLGLVITVAHDNVENAVWEITAQGIAELGLPQGNRIPACLIAKPGCEREQIAAMESLSAVLRVEVAFAQVLTENDL